MREPIHIYPLPPQGSNSTMFTECCMIAICREQLRCPVCDKLVIGHDALTDDERANIRWKNATKGWKR